MSDLRFLTELRPGAEILVGGDRVVRVSDELAARFREGDALLPVVDTGEVLHVPARERELAARSVGRADAAFRQMGAVSDERIDRFFEAFATRLESAEVWDEIAATNATDVADARARGRSVTRLVADEKLRSDMVEGLRGWIGTESRRGRVLETVEHAGFRVDLVGAELGVIGFVFEGRPNVLADASGVLRGGNTVVFRIGRDALRTARALMGLAVEPALEAAELPEGALALVDSPEHAAGWALFSDRRLSLAVARGSGPAVATLGAIAGQAGIPASLHGTGGAWIVASRDARADPFAEAVERSVDRKVCNTLNVCCIPRERSAELVPLFLDALRRAGERRGQSFKLHVVRGSEADVPAELFERVVRVRRAEGDVAEKQAELVEEATLANEWEWEETPEVTLTLVGDVDEAIGLFNRYSPQFIASLIGDDAGEQERFYQRINAPFVGDAHTRWVDGQFALQRPELGLSNWQSGRLFARGGILSGDSAYTVRTRYRTYRED